jgi:hypothetical protein
MFITHGPLKKEVKIFFGHGLHGANGEIRNLYERNKDYQKGNAKYESYVPTDTDG